VRIFEIVSVKNPFKPLSPEQLRVKALQDQIKRKQNALKRERALQKTAKAQKTLLRLDKI
jgi:predicted GIY-YIG superfamily endonuclease